MHAKIVKIGNSRGVRIPKPLLEEAKLGSAVEIVAEGGTLVIRSARLPRAGWAEAFRNMAKRGDDSLLDASGPRSRWDEENWQWR